MKHESEYSTDGITSMNLDSLPNENILSIQVVQGTTTWLTNYKSGNLRYLYIDQVSRYQGEHNMSS